MKLLLPFVTALLCILLFTYAATSKLLEYETFVIQLGQSPLLSAYAPITAILVPGIEFGVVLLLLFQKTRSIGLYASYGLMCVFTIYVGIILYFAPFTPCSCGGILEAMDWNQHLLFNCCFVVLTGLALLWQHPHRHTAVYLVLIALFSGTSLGIMNILSEETLNYHNNFTRRLPQQFPKEKEIDLGVNSYYIAGAEKGKIYLGNTTAPLLLTVLDTNLTHKKEIVLRLNNTQLPFRSLQLQIKEDNFYGFDGTIPVIFKGKIGNWYGYQQPTTPQKFANPIVIDSQTVIYRTHLPNTENTLGSWHLNTRKSKVYPNLLQKQIDGIFDTDGVLNFDSYTQKIVYNYYYRNGYVVANQDFKLVRRGQTIDTFKKAQVKVVYDSLRNERKLASPPKTINKYSYCYNGLLFVNANSRAKNETDKVIAQTSVIDVYALQDGKYLVSFYIYTNKRNPLNRFIIEGKHCFGIVGTNLVRYRLGPMVTNYYTVKE